MKIKISTHYKDFDITIENDYLSSSDRAKTVREIYFVMENIDERNGNIQDNGIQTVSILDDGEVVSTDYTKVTNNQKTYLRKLGLTDEKIAKIKSKDEASAIITRLTTGKDNNDEK